MRTTLIGAVVVLLAVLALTLAGPVPAQGPEVVVYSARHYGQEAAFEAFTKKTGITVKVLTGQTGELFERLKAEGERTPADVLLAKIDSPELTSNIPAYLRDPDQRWFGLTVRARTIMYNSKKVTPAELSTYEALGDPNWKGRLCLRTSSYIYNQSMLGTMISRYGEPRTEAIVRGWVANNPTLIAGDTKSL